METTSSVSASTNLTAFLSTIFFSKNLKIHQNFRFCKQFTIFVVSLYVLLRMSRQGKEISWRVAEEGKIVIEQVGSATGKIASTFQQET